MTCLAHAAPKTTYGSETGCTNKPPRRAKGKGVGRGGAREGCADLELALVIADGEQETVPAGLQVGALLAHQLCQQLLLQAWPCDCEVDQGHLDTHLRQVVGVGQGSGHVQLEPWMVLGVCVS